MEINLTRREMLKAGALVSLVGVLPGPVDSKPPVRKFLPQCCVLNESAMLRLFEDQKHVCEVYFLIEDAQRDYAWQEPTWEIERGQLGGVNFTENWVKGEPDQIVTELISRSPGVIEWQGKMTVKKRPIYFKSIGIYWRGECIARPQPIEPVYPLNPHDTLSVLWSANLIDPADDPAPGRWVGITPGNASLSSDPV